MVRPTALRARSHPIRPIALRKRTAALAISAAVTIVDGFMLFGGGTPRSEIQSTRAEPDSVWYHAGDVALLGRTNRPQLVEFFHPG